MCVARQNDVHASLQEELRGKRSFVFEVPELAVLVAGLRR